MVVLNQENIYSFYEISKNWSIEVFLELRRKVASLQNKERISAASSAVQCFAYCFNEYVCESLCMRRKMYVFHGDSELYSRLSDAAFCACKLLFGLCVDE